MAIHTGQLLTEKQAAELLAVSFTTLTTWRCRRRHGLRFVRLGGGRAIRYRLCDLIEFADAGLGLETSHRPSQCDEQAAAGGA